MLILTACDTTETTQNKLTNLPENTAQDSFKTATSTLDDVGLREEEIPDILHQAVEHPYAGTAKMPCAQARAELAKLDALLGPDIDVPKNKEEMSNGEVLLNHGSDFLHDTVVDFVRGQTSILPFRGIVRQITGASSHEKAVRDARQAGQLRRAYLKGLMQASTNGKCLIPPPTPPAAPPIQEASVSLTQ